MLLNAYVAINMTISAVKDRIPYAIGVIGSVTPARAPSSATNWTAASTLVLLKTWVQC